MNNEDKISKIQAIVNEHNESDSKLIKKIKAIIEPKSNNHFIPELGQDYFIVEGGYVRACMLDNDDFDVNTLKSCIAHETYGGAELELKRNQAEIAVTRRLRELEGDWVADWGNVHQIKCIPSLDTVKDRLFVVKRRYELVVRSEWVSSEETWKQVLEEMPAQVKLMMLGAN